MAQYSIWSHSPNRLTRIKQDAPELNTQMPPHISVVIASVVGPPFIDDCVASVLSQVGAPSFEVIVVDCHGPENVARLRSKFPEVRVVPRENRETVPHLRRIGLEQASGEIVAIIEEHCLADRNWLATLAGAFSPGYAAVGGPVAPRDYDRLRDWVTYFIEYNSYLPPWSEGEAFNLSGANLAYRREVLWANVDLLSDGYWEATLHPKLLREGSKFRSVPHMVVYHRGPFDYGYYLRQRYLFSRAFAGARKPALSWGQRAAYLLGAPAVLTVLIARIAGRVRAKSCHPDKFLLSLPLLIPALGSYVVGEWMGYAFGPGRALLQVE
jgi:glycosyltransferase involved in cell wall biosynthesis